MKVTCILGSPRPKGNSTKIAECFLETARELGAETETFAINKMSYKGCQGCEACKKKLEKCAVKDDIATALDSAREADVVVLATPVYYADVSSQMKAFIDRTYSYLKPDFMERPDPCRLAPGKKMVIITAQGGGEDSYTEVFTKYKLFFRFYGFEEVVPIRACDVNDLGAVDSRDDIMTLAEDTARRLLAQ